MQTPVEKIPLTLTMRPLNPHSDKEIARVADQMQKTLIDVMGLEKGENYYSKQWLLDRVQFHINLKEKASVLLACDEMDIIGQAIVRIEEDKKGTFGFFSTIYVDPEFRRRGVANKLINEILQWCKGKELSYLTYNTAINNENLIRLLGLFDFQKVHQVNGMVQLKKVLKNSIPNPSLSGE